MFMNTYRLGKQHNLDIIVAGSSQANNIMGLNSTFFACDVKQICTTKLMVQSASMLHFSSLCDFLLVVTNIFVKHRRVV